EIPGKPWGILICDIRHEAVFSQKMMIAAMSPFAWIGIMCAVVVLHTDPFLETVLRIGLVAKMPFSNISRAIFPILQQFRKRMNSRCKTLVIAFASVIVGVQSSEDGSP